MTAAYTPTQRIRIALIAGLVPIVIAAVGAWILLGLDDLPDPIATHWNAAGAPDGFGTVAATVILLGILISVFALLSTVPAVVLKAGPAGSYIPRVLVATSVWLSAFLVIGIGGSVWQQRGLVDAAAAPSPVVPLLVALAVAVPLAVGAWLVTPKPATLERAESEPTALALGADERVLWTRSAMPAAHFVAAFVLGVVSVLGAAVLGGIVGGQSVILVFLVPFVIILLVSTTLFWRVRIDASGFAARSALGFPRFTYPIESIVEARASEIVALREFGGWGIRAGSQGRWGVILRGGDALEIERVDGRVFVITIDDAATAASLVNGLVQRAAVTR